MIHVAHLFTPTRQHLYARLGWRELDTELYITRQLTIMVCDLPPDPSPAVRSGEE